MHNELKKVMKEYYGAGACKHTFTYYKYDDLIACSLTEVIDVRDGFYINHNCECCEFFEFNLDLNCLLDPLEDIMDKDEDIHITDAMVFKAVAEVKRNERKYYRKNRYWAWKHRMQDQIERFAFMIWKGKKNG